jgi:hypothetical protein
MKGITKVFLLSFALYFSAFVSLYSGMYFNNLSLSVLSFILIVAGLYLSIRGVILFLDKEN